MKIFTSVIGFNFNVTILDNEGNALKTGAKVIVPVNMGAPNVGTKIGGQSWFTNYNEQLLNKIRDYRRRND
jgi:aspartate ammonia-lyase